MVVRFISKGKGRKRKVIPLNKKKKGVSVRSVSLRPSAVVKVNKEQIKLLNKGEPATFSKALNQVIIRARREGIPIYDTHVNSNDRRKPYLMWIVKDPKGHAKVKGSETIVMAEHYGQAIDDFITIWNKEKRKKITIGYPQVQGTADKSFRFKRDEKGITSVDSFVDAQKLGIETDGTVGTVVLGSGENYKIIGYKQGQTFTSESIKHLSEFIKEYQLTVDSDPHSDYGKIFATTDQTAKMIARDLLNPHTEFGLTRIEKKFTEVK